KSRSAPATVTAPPMKPSKPLRAAPPLKVFVLAELSVSVPIPLRVPLRVTRPTVGSVPRGKLQSLLIVFVPLWANDTWLNIAPPQVLVTLEPPSNTGALLSLKVPSRANVTVVETLAECQGAVKLPPVCSTNA